MTTLRNLDVRCVSNQIETRRASSSEPIAREGRVLRFGVLKP